VEKELQNFRSDAVIHKRVQLLQLLPRCYTTWHSVTSQ